MKRIQILFTACIGVFICSLASGINSPAMAQQASKIQDLVYVKNAEPLELIGYGLVTGLDRSGDRSLSSQSASFTVQSVANMLENFGITVDAEQLRTRNVAAVMVTARLSPYQSPGSRIDVTVSSLGDASSLQGGVLLVTPLMNPENQNMYARAQGPLLVGGVNSEIPGARIRRNQTMTATIPSGALVIQNQEVKMSLAEPLRLALKEPNFSNARTMTEAINARFEEEIAKIAHAGLVEINWPDNIGDKSMMNIFTSLVLEEEVSVINEARIVINERTGTIVAGGSVLIDNVMISHGNLQVRTQLTPVISQPNAFSGGETQVLNLPQTEINEEIAQTIILEPETTVQELSVSLNTLGLTPRDIISIFQALDRAGVLRGELIVM
jgi:flagellar P-ring protein FlgI